MADRPLIIRCVPDGTPIIDKDRTLFLIDLTTLFGRIPFDIISEDTIQALLAEDVGLVSQLIDNTITQLNVGGYNSVEAIDGGINPITAINDAENTPFDIIVEDAPINSSSTNNNVTVSELQLTAIEQTSASDSEVVDSININLSDIVSIEIQKGGGI